MSDDIFAGIDMADPCVVWPRLEEVLFRLIAGQTVVRGRFGEDEMEFRPGDIRRLETWIERLKERCENKGRRPRRRAITFG